MGDQNDPIDLVAVGLNMLAEELQHSIEKEQRLRETLEERVAERTQELEHKMLTIAEQSRTILELSTPVIQGNLYVFHYLSILTCNASQIEYL